MGAGGDGVFAGGHPGFGPGGLAFEIDLDGLHRLEIDDHGSIGHAVAGGAVPAASHRQFDPVLFPELHQRGDVIAVCHLGDQGRIAIEETEEDGPGLVVSRIFRGKNLALQFPTNQVSRDSANGTWISHFISLAIGGWCPKSTLGRLST